MAGGVPDKPLIHSCAHGTMDQTVTSKWHKEAYNSGEVQLDDFLTKSTTPTIDPEHRAVFVDEGNHRFSGRPSSA